MTHCTESYIICIVFVYIFVFVICRKKYNLWIVMEVVHLMLLASFLQITKNGEVEIKLHTVKTDGRVGV